MLPQVHAGLCISQALYFWESNTRSATIIGAVGAGGIGLKLWEAMRTNSDWENVAYMVLLILIVVFLFRRCFECCYVRASWGNGRIERETMARSNERHHDESHAKPVIVPTGSAVLGFGVE